MINADKILIDHTNLRQMNWRLNADDTDGYDKR